MTPNRQIRVDDVFSVTVPEGWEADRDEEGGLDLYAPDGAGLLHLVGFPQPAGEILDPAEELYVFLEDQGIELEEDEVEDLTLSEEADLALCEYVAESEEEGEEEEDDEGEGASYWMIAVATAPGALVFASYSCPAGEEEGERGVVRSILASLRLTPNP